MPTTPAGPTTPGTDSYQVFDLDADGRADALSDGIIFVRYLFGATAFSDDALVRQVLNNNSRRRDGAAVRAYLDAGNPHLCDVNDDGVCDALSDGVIVVRYLFGGAFEGDRLVANAMGPDAQRTDHQAVRDWIRINLIEARVDWED